MSAQADLITCPICGKAREKSRRWAIYCSARCRKAAHTIRKKAETPADIRASLARIEAKIDRLLTREEKAHE